MAAEMKLETYLQTVSTGNHFVKGECEKCYSVSYLVKYHFPFEEAGYRL